jgi:hypothetical protein
VARDPSTQFIKTDDFEIRTGCDAMTGLSDKEETRLGRGIPRHWELADHSHGPRAQGSGIDALMNHANLSFLEPVRYPA